MIDPKPEMAKECSTIAEFEYSILLSFFHPDESILCALCSPFPAAIKPTRPTDIIRNSMYSHANRKRMRDV